MIFFYLRTKKKTDLFCMSIRLTRSVCLNVLLLYYVLFKAQDDKVDQKIKLNMVGIITFFCRKFPLSSSSVIGEFVF